MPRNELADGTKCRADVPGLWAAFPWTDRGHQGNRITVWFFLRIPDPQGMESGAKPSGPR
jgi:hypothetical protein